MKRLLVFLLSGLLLYCSSCSTKKQNISLNSNEETKVYQLPSVLIYKMKQDYSRNVPILMNSDKSQIVSYPDPSDLCPGGKCAYPTPLIEGFWLDNRGIGKNVVFLSYTYEEYAALPTAPSVSTLAEQIIDYYPLTELYRCGKRVSYTNLVDDLNLLIRSGDYKKNDNLVQ